MQIAITFRISSKQTTFSKVRAQYEILSQAAMASADQILALLDIHLDSDDLKQSCLRSGRS